MIRIARRIPRLIALAVLTGCATAPAQAQQRARDRGAEKVDHPRLRAALQELREARAELKQAPDGWPPGYRDRALESITGAIQSVKTILAVKDVDTFRGVDRDPDYYKQYPTYSHLRAALADLREAREELRAAKADFGGQKEKALDDIDVAVGDIITLVRYQKR